MARTPIPSDDALSLVNATAIALDKDKNSQSAVRWAIENVKGSKVMVLLHVTHKNHHYQAIDSSDSGDVSEQLFSPFRGFCARRGVQLKEVVLDDIDAARALLDFIGKNLIGSLIIGASKQNSITRKFKSPDIASTVMKNAPDFCSVYVITKGKLQSIQMSQRSPTNCASLPKVPPPQALPPPVRGDSLERDDGIRAQIGKPESMRLSHLRRERSRLTPPNPSVDSINISFPGQRGSFGQESTSDESEIFRASPEIPSQNLDISFASGSPAGTHTPQSVRDMEAEMRRLKLELKQTMDMYSTACKEALSAKKKASELQQSKMEESRKFEEARLAGEAALAIVEIEKAKCKAALKAAEKAQKMVEVEAQKRKNAEMKARRESEEKNRALTALHGEMRYRRYTIDEIEVATEKFAQAFKVGEGGYGPVYRGKLDHTNVAIKVLRPDAKQGKRQFQQEIEVLSCMRHPNMVILLGACPEYGILVYEYMDYGSLEDRLLQKENTPPLSWRKRFKIAAEIATALLFLHQSKPEPLVHRDLKPANILLDTNYVSKISDVGLARLVPPSVADSVTQYHLTSAAGTFCYIDPEYQQTGKLTTRSDIYSLGIMLLQVITAKPPMGLAHQVGKAIERGTFAEILDPSVPDWPVEEALNFAKLALKCAELRKKDRPSLATVVVPELNRLRELGRNAAPGRSQGSSNGRRLSSKRNSFSIEPSTSSLQTRS